MFEQLRLLHLRAGATRSRSWSSRSACIGVLLLLHGTRAVQMLIGIVVLVLTYALAWVLKLDDDHLSARLRLQVRRVRALVVFQPELRAALAHLGQSRVTRFFRRMEASEVAEEIAEAVERLSRSGIGCIIALEREIVARRLRAVAARRCRRR